MTITALKDGRFIEVNDSFLKITGLQCRDEIIGRTVPGLNIWPDASIPAQPDVQNQVTGSGRNLQGIDIRGSA